MKIQIGSVLAADILIKNGAKVNIEDENGNTPMVLAVKHGKCGKKLSN